MAEAAMWAEVPREPVCVCDALGMCPAACAQCPACSSSPVTHVIYCRGCRLAWIEPSEYEPGCCACECTDVNDPLYEDWTVDPDPASIPPGAWGERMPL